ncbi:C-C motif chemokine 20 [Parambassis ranga]|uniref:C-C motif chemokine 20 n=1 Tax=Parambassis ranga TaxID=210632 RepID=A0A6P7K4C4_9TELE|nr:C-C motif chemokine 20-like [Parambassis ranga]
MRFNTLFFLLILTCLCLALAQVSYDDCCLKYVQCTHNTMHRHIEKHAVKYRHQKADGGCNIPAVIFTMRKGRIICADPKEEWVLKVMKGISERNQKKNKQVHAQLWRKG